MTFADSAEAAADGAHGIVLMTEWDEFREINYNTVFDRMYKPAFLFDGRNLLDAEALAKIGFEVHSIGKSAHYPRHLIETPG